MIECHVQYRPILQAFTSVASTIAAALSHRNHASAEIPHDSCGAQESDKRNTLYYKGLLLSCSSESEFSNLE
jgi:hypothetical protein